MNKNTNFLVKVVFESAKFIDNEFSVMDKDGHGDLVTCCDIDIEKFLFEKLSKKFPTHSFVSEELNPEQELTPDCFVIDPLDGTINFAHGLPLFGIQVAMISKGKTVVSVIYLPRLGELFFADSGGAFVIKSPTASTLTAKHAHKISVSQTPPERALYLVEGGDKFAALGRLNQQTRHWRYFCCTAVNCAWTACGRLGGTILRKDNVWDYLPGQYLVEQAGGVVINKPGAHIAANCLDMAEMLLLNNH